MLESGTEAFLRQAHRNNWQRYLASLGPNAAGGWDTCVVTASNERQAAMYRKQIALRERAGLLPSWTRFEVIADPDGQRIGSGGATLRVLRLLEATGAEPPSGRSSPLGQRVLVIHSGGDSRRLPHCSAVGKLFARIPRPLPDGRSSTLFDEFLISLSGVAQAVPPGLLVASGDVLLLFDHLQLGLQQRGVSGVAAAAPAELGTHHGVYVCDEGRRLRAYLHKPSEPVLGKWNAVSDAGMVDIDTGLVWFDEETTRKLVELADEPPLRAFSGEYTGDGSLEAGLNLYGDLLLPLARSTTLEGYVADTSDGPATSSLRAARQVIWQRMRGVPFAVEQLQPAAFLHFGTSQEYWELLTSTPEAVRARRLCGWSVHTASWISERAQQAGDGLATIGALVEGDVIAQGAPVLAVDAHLRGTLTAQDAALVVGVSTDRALSLRAGTVVHQLPLPEGHVTRVYGLADDPKYHCDDPGATFMNRPWAAWLADAEIAPEVIWPEVPAEGRTLWNARLYPVAPDREQSLDLSLPLQDPGRAPLGWRATWERSARLSLAESYVRADNGRILHDMTETEDQVAAQRFYAAVEDEQPATEIVSLLGTRADLVERRSVCVAERLASADPVTQLRGYKALEIATGDKAWEDRAFRILAEMIEGTVGIQPSAPPRDSLAVQSGEAQTPARSPVRVEAAARIDFGGGWTDTPPYSIERGGTVLNAAVTLRGHYPIVIEAEWTEEPQLAFESCDIDASIVPSHLGEVLAYRNPADAFALLKAAVVLRGLVPADGDPGQSLAELLGDRGGVRLCTQTDIPRGSGLGTSSILAGAVLTALAHLLGVELTDERLFQEVLCLEQMMTTGGGWQDQVGGLTGGIKLVSTDPGLPQQIEVMPAQLAPETEAELAERLLLVYTGQQRLAKNLLQRVMGRWMSRDPEMVWIQDEIASLALAMRAALEAGDVDGFGELLSEHWVLNKRMDPGCTNPFIDELFEVMRPYLNGCKLAGAGGGGFVIAVARGRDDVRALEGALARVYAGTRVNIWPCGIPESGIVSHRGRDDGARVP